MPTAFASTDELDAAALSAAPVRWPRPSRLDEPVTWKPRPAAEAAEALGLTTVGELLDHLPRDSGEARTIAELVRRRDGDGHRRGALDHARARCAGAG